MKFDAQKFAGAMAFVGAAQFLIVGILVAESLEAAPPGTYNVATDVISDLGNPDLSRVALMFNASAFLGGLFILVAAFFLYQSHKLKLLPGLLAVTGVGAIGIGIFPETNPTPHTIFAFVAFLFGGLAAFFSFYVFRGVLGYISAALGLLSLASLALFAAGRFANVSTPLGAGGVERLIVYPVVFWILALGSQLMGTFSPASASAAPQTQTY